MYNDIYVVIIYADSKYCYFHKEENAQNFLWECYLDDNSGLVGDDVYETDKVSCFNENYIEDYGRIIIEVYED